MSLSEINKKLLEVLKVANDIRASLFDAKELYDDPTGTQPRKSGKAREEAIELAHAPVFTRLKQYIAVLERCRGTRDSGILEILKEDGPLLLELQTDAFKQKLAFWNILISHVYAKADKIEEQLYRHRGQLTLLAVDLQLEQRAAELDVFEKLTKNDKTFWFQNFNTQTFVTVSEFLTALEEFVGLLYHKPAVHPDFLRGICRLMEKHVGGQGPDGYVSVTDFANFMRYWGPLPLLTVKACSVLDAEGALQSWFAVSKVKRDACFRNKGFAVWCQEPGVFHTRLATESTHLAIQNDSLAQNSPGCGYFVRYGRVVNHKTGEVDSHATLGECVSNYLKGAVVTSAPPYLDPRHSAVDLDRSPTTKPDHKTMEATERLHKVRQEFDERIWKFRRLQIKGAADMDRFTSMTHELSKQLDAVLREFGSHSNNSTPAASPNLGPSNDVASVMPALSLGGGRYSGSAANGKRSSGGRHSGSQVSAAAARSGSNSPHSGSSSASPPSGVSPAAVSPTAAAGLV